MQAATSLSPLPAEQKPSLVNLFAYLRDLFDLSEPLTQFDPDGQGRDLRWWALADLLDWPLEGEAHKCLVMNFKQADKPLLTLRRPTLPTWPELPHELQGWAWIEDEQLLRKDAQPEAFDVDPQRVAAYTRFYQQVNGQPIAQVGNLDIPPALDAWLTFDATAEDTVQIGHQAERAQPFAADPQRVEAWEAFLPRFEATRQIRATLTRLQALYDGLHRSHFESAEQQPLALSFGLLSGGHEAARYRHFLFHVPLTLHVQQGEISLRVAEELPIRCEQDFTEWLEAWFPQDSARAIEARRQAVLQQVDAFNAQNHEFSLEANYLRYRYHAAATQILSALPAWEDHFLAGAEPRWEFDEAQPAQGLRFSFSPVIRLSEPEGEQRLSRDAGRIVRRLYQLMQQGKTEQVPAFFGHLFSLKSSEASLRIAYKRKESARALSGDDQLQMDAPGDENRFFFPLPYNQEQLAIAQRLEKQDAVTVKGPPGTGKSHTIANLIAHHAALGQRVLVVSKNPKALEVIQGKLPPQLRELAVAFLQEGMPASTLKHAIDAVKDHLGQRTQREEVQQKAIELNELNVRIVYIREQIENTLAAQHTTFALVDPLSGITAERSLSAWADVQAQLPATVHWLKEPLPEGVDVDETLTALLHLHEAWLASDHELAGYDWPDAGSWLPMSALREQSERLCEIERTVDLSEYQSLPPSCFDLAFLGEWEALQPHLSVLRRQADWVQHPNFRRDLLREVLLEHGQRLNQLDAQAAQFLAFAFDFRALGQSDPDQWLGSLLSLMDRYDRDGTLNLLTRKLLPKAEKAWYDCLINGQPVSSYRDLRKCADYLHWLAQQKQLRITVDNYLANLTTGQGGVGEGQPSSDLEQARQRLSDLRATEQALIEVEAFNAKLSARSLPSLDPLAPNDEAAQWLAGLQDVAEARERQATLQEAWQRLRESFPREEEGLHPAVVEVLAALSAQDADAYATACERYCRLRDAAEALGELHAAAEEWAQVLPATVARLREAEVPGELTLSDLQEDSHRQALQQLLDREVGKLAELTPQLDEWRALRQRRAALVAEVVAAQAWEARRAQVTDAQLSSLAAWRNDLVNVGKGHGKNTARQLASARQNLQAVQAAIPVWIMQQDLVADFFDQPEPGQFDLLIIDEASQCDISALNLIFRAKKSVIVGDENQTAVSVNAAQYPIERTNRLLDRYLVSHPYQQQFNLNNRSASIYSLSGVIFPNIVTLREHFRCRPEIIDFCNREVYQSQIQPLRIPLPSPLGAPTEVHYIEDDPKDAKKPHLVKQVAQLLLSLIEDFEAGELAELPTVGVIGLESSNEAHRELLLKELGRNRHIKAYAEAMQLTVGTARTLQGDERDLIVLTSTASHHYTVKGKLRPPRAVLGEEMMRIYNVAVSRAREKVLLLHSILPEVIPLMNEQCYRRRLIEWMMAGDEATTPPKVKRSESLKATPSAGKQAFAQWLASETEGDWQPDFPVGDTLLDFVWLRAGQPVGIIWDEGKDAPTLAQQATLERAGWQVLRIPALSWWAGTWNGAGEMGNLCAKSG